MKKYPPSISWRSHEILVLQAIFFSDLGQVYVISRGETVLLGSCLDPPKYPPWKSPPCFPSSGILEHTVTNNPPLFQMRGKQGGLLTRNSSDGVGHNYGSELQQNATSQKEASQPERPARHRYGQRVRHPAWYYQPRQPATGCACSSYILRCRFSFILTPRNPVNKGTHVGRVRCNSWTSPLKLNDRESEGQAVLFATTFWTLPRDVSPCQIKRAFRHGVRGEQLTN